MFRSTALKAVSAFAASLVLFSSPLAHAGPDSRGWAGGLLGLTVPDADNSSSRSMWGITAGAKLGSEWGIGAYYLNSEKSDEFDMNLYGVQFGYHFEGEANGVFIAGRIGTSKLEAGPLEWSPTNLGVVAGYDYMLGEHLSLGGEASFMSVGKDNGADSFTLLSFLGAVKFWF